MLTSRKEELEEFKCLIDLPAYIESRGYQLDQRASSRRYRVLRHANGDKLIVTRKAGGHWVYSNVRDERDRGTIIDFIANRDHVSLGEIRKILRPFIGAWASSPGLLRSDQNFGHADGPGLAKVRAAWDRATPLTTGLAYLEQRGIPRRVMMHSAFAASIRTDRRGNALFAHHGADGLCGFEIKNQGFTGFATGGAKALFRSAPHQDTNQLVVFETAIDLLSYAALFGIEGAIMVSTAGQVSSAQRSLLIAEAQRLPTTCKIILATDNDEGGLRMASSHREIFIAAGIEPARIVSRHPPKPGQDWNDALRSTKGLTLPRFELVCDVPHSLLPPRRWLTALVVIIGAHSSVSRGHLRPEPIASRLDGRSPQSLCRTTHISSVPLRFRGDVPPSSPPTPSVSSSFDGPACRDDLQVEAGCQSKPSLR